METTNKVNDDLKTIKSSFEISAVKKNLITALQEIKEIAAKKNYVVEGSIDKIISDINLENTTLCSRKKLAKKIYYFTKKKSLKTTSSLLSFVRKLMGEEYRVTIKSSLLEQEIVSMRQNYKKLYAETEAARIAWKEKKKLFYIKSV